MAIALAVRIIRVEKRARNDLVFHALPLTPVLRTRCAGPAKSMILHGSPFVEGYATDCAPLPTSQVRERRRAANVGFTKVLQGFAITV